MRKIKSKRNKREIRFRAWDKELKEMCGIQECVFDENGVSSAVLIGIDWKEERPLTELELMQYTNLKDKNGKEIWEGDILNTNYQPKTVIPYYVKSALPFLELVNKEGWEYDNGDYYEGANIQRHEWRTFEVIGNIYENPELLNHE